MPATGKAVGAVTQAGTMIKPTREQHRRHRRWLIGQIRKKIESLPNDCRPVVMRRGEDLILDYGIYQESYNLRSGIIELHNWSIGDLLRGAETLAARYRESPIGVERDAANGCIGCVRYLREQLTNLDACHDGATLADTLTFEIANSLIELGRRMEQLKNVLPLQSRARTGLRQAVRNRHIAQENALTDDDLRSRYEAVQAELAAQATRGERISRENAYKHVANELGLTDHGAVKKSYQKWAKRVG